MKFTDDWRITLGITLGVLVFSGVMVVMGKTVDQAWLTIQAITGVVIGASAWIASRPR